MQTKESIRDHLDYVQYLNYVWHVGGADRLWIQATFLAPDCKTGELTLQHTRKWYVSHEATKSEIVQTAFKLVLTSIEHEAREAFKYMGHTIFGPHYDVDKLVQLCEAGAEEHRA